MSQQIYLIMTRNILNIMYLEAATRVGLRTPFLQNTSGPLLLYIFAVRKSILKGFENET